MIDEPVRLKMDESIILTLGTKLYSQPTWWILLKELTQNAIDAGATVINIKTNFTDKLEYIDNGYGMTSKQIHEVFTTVGGTEKERKVDTVGGFGIAKLAIFSCDDFRVISLNSCLTKDILVNHQPLEKLDTPITGTSVFVMKQNLFPWSAEKYVTWYLAAINRPVVIWLNDNLIKPHEVNTIMYDNTTPLETIRAYDWGYYYVLVRANGLPLFKSFISSVSGGSLTGATILYDIETDLMPYDENYPFSVTREGFVSTSEHEVTVSNIIRTVSKSLDEQHTLDEVKRKAVSFNKDNKIWEMFQPQITPDAKEALKLFESQISLLYWIKGEPVSCQYGLMGIDPELNSNRANIAAYQEATDHSPEIFYLRDNITDPSLIIASAIHEFTHRYYKGHYEDFASEMTRLVGQYLSFVQHARQPNII